jgi:hypothetical protein
MVVSVRSVAPYMAKQFFLILNPEPKTKPERKRPVLSHRPVAPPGLEPGLS